MGEAWDSLAAFRTLRTQCADDVAHIVASCAQDHPQYRYILECRECYGKVIERMRSWCVASKDEEWFSRQGDFLVELDGMLNEALEYKMDLEAIDARIGAERNIWYEQQLKASPSIRKSLEELLDRRDVYAKFGSKDVAFEELVTETREVLGGAGTANGLSGTEAAKKTLDSLMAVKSPEDRLRVYKETFFQGNPDEEVSENTQMYLDRLQEGATMDEIVNKITLDRRSSIGQADQKAKHRKKIEDFRRARAAYELQKSKKASTRKDSTQAPQPPKELYDQPPCSVCGKEPNLQDFAMCPLCQVLLEPGIRQKPTVYCSANCVEQGQEAHVEEAHRCAGGDNCAQIVDEDIDMDFNSSGIFLCRECLKLHKLETVFCSLRCADINFQHHRDHVHVPRRRERDIIVDEEAGDIVFDDGDKSKYHARDIVSHVAHLGDLLRDFGQRNAVDVEPLD